MTLLEFTISLLIEASALALLGAAVLAVYAIAAEDVRAMLYHFGVESEAKRRAEWIASHPFAPPKNHEVAS